MSSTEPIATLLLAAALLSGCGHGLAVPSYDEVILRHQSLAHGHPDVTRILFYGESVENRPLMALRIARVPMSPEADSVLVIGAIHGDEYMNIVDRLGEWLLNQAHDNWLERFLDTGGRIYLVPVANPDGFENWRTHRFRPRRRNANRVDLNRDFDALAVGEPRLTQPETRRLVEMLARDQAVVRLVVYYHCCAEALGYPGGHYQLSLPRLEKERHVQTAQHLAKILWGDIAVGDWKSVLDYTGKGNATDYFYERYGALSFLFEGNFNEQDYFSRHTEAWRYLLTTTMGRGRNDDGK